MLISESKCFIFVHVQKTAGSSLRDLLSPYTLKPDHGRLSRVLSELNLQRDWRRRFIAKRRRSQWWMIWNAAGDMGLDFVGRFENLLDDTAAMCRLLDIPVTAIPHHKRLITKDYRSAYSDRLAEQVGNAWQDEIEYFGYHFRAP